MTPSREIRPLFSPLRINYSWEGSFEYRRVDHSHAWDLSDSRTWKRTKLEIRHGSTKVIRARTVLMHKLAKRYSAGLVSSCIRKARALTKASRRKVSVDHWQLLAWLSGKNPTNRRASGGLSLVLNALVRQSTTRPFEIISSFVDEHVAVEVRQLESYVPSWFYINTTPWEDLDEFLISFPELFLDKGKNRHKLVPNADVVLEALKSVRIRHHYEVTRFEQNDLGIKVTLRDDAEVVTYQKGAVCGCLPIPGKSPREYRREPEGVNAPEVAASSPVIAKALLQLSRVWQDANAKSVLISSPPGSGKEVFAGSIPLGNGRPAEKTAALSLASEDYTGLERQLYGFQSADGSVQDGLIAKVAGGALFLDEVHQPEQVRASPLRASLLRTLEAGVYFPVEHSSHREVQNVLWIFATSKSIKELEQFAPVDFWTRMSHALEIPHPLNGQSKLAAAILADFFRVFWWDLCERHYHLDPTCDPNKLPVNSIPAYWQQRRMLREIVAGDGTRRTGQSDPAQLFASRFIADLRRSGIKPSQFSVRGLRNVVSYLFASACSQVAQGKEPWANRDAFLAEAAAAIKDIRNVARI